MRKLSVLLMLVFCCSKALAQQRSVSIRVTDSTGNPIPYVAAKVSGTKSGALADASGNISINVKEGDVVNLSVTGYNNQSVTISAKSIYPITLSSNNTSLAEIVVTGAYNSKRSNRSVSYNAQVVSGEQLNTIRQTNLNAGLVGKVSGIQFRGQSTMKLGNAGSVQLRGASGLGTGEGIIYVVDGTILPDINDINLDDIDNVSVLQGPSAAAQFGSQGANGAIVVTMKKGSKTSKGLNVDVNLGLQVDKVYILPNYQNSYGGGSNQDMSLYTWQTGQPEEWKALSGKYYHNYDDDASWGPRMLGQEYIPWYAWYGGTQYSYKTAKLTPQPNNAREFYNTGVTYNNSVSVSKVTDVDNYRFSFGNINTKGNIPNSNLRKSTFNFSDVHTINNKLTLATNINFVSQKINGLVTDDGYGNESTGSFNSWFHRDLDMGIMKELRNLKTPEGIYASWNHNNPGSYNAATPLNFYGANYWYNFYTFFDNEKYGYQKDRLYGDLSLNYQATNELKFKATYRRQQTTDWVENTISTDLQKSATQTGTKGYYYTYSSYFKRENYELMANYSKIFADKYSVNVSAGTDFYRFINKSNSANTNNGLTVPNFYAISNSVDQPTVSNTRTEEAYNAAYATGNFGYKNFAFADVSFRKDWYSTLPPNQNNVLSKSAGVSFVFSDLIKVKSISFAKLRASWGEIPQALGTTITTFGAYRYPGATYSVGANQWAGNIVSNTPDQLVDPNIKGAVKSQKEIGLEMKFLKNRVGFAVTYWNGNQKAMPVALAINGTSGYTSYLTNGGLITSKGVDVQFNARPVSSKNVSWEINATWSRLIDNTVKSLSNGSIVVDQTPVQYSAFTTNTPYMVQKKGMKWGQLYSNGIKTINGKRVLNSDGSYVRDGEKYFGSVLPLYTGGMQQNFVIFKAFTVNASLDYQVGGKMFSLSNMWGSYSGLTKRTATVNDKGNPIRDKVADGGGVHVSGVDADGKAADYYVDAQTYFHNLYNNKTMDDFVYDLTYVKLREVSVGYIIPVKKLGLGNVLTKAVFSLVARNPVLIYAQTKDFDPGEISATSGENGQFPGTRSYGFNLKVSF